VVIEFIAVDSKEPVPADVVRGTALARAIIAATPRVPFALRTDTLALLVLLDKCEALTVNEIRDALGVAQATASAIVERCAVDGLVRKRRSRKDARCVFVKLSPKAQQWMRRTKGP